jgi:hypothetical protein
MLALDLNFSSKNPYGFGRIFLSYDLNDGLEIAAVWRLGVTLKGGHIPRAEYATNAGQVEPRLHFNF